LFDPQEKADEVSRWFAFPSTIAGCRGRIITPA
jgi:hypothetical protein